MGEGISPNAAAAALAALALVLVGTAAVRLGRRRRRCRDAWAALERRLKERLELAPRVASIASLYIAWNDPRIMAVGAARREALRTHDVVARTRGEADLSLALGRLMAAMEAVPELERHADLAAALEALAEAENHAAAACLAYNREAEALALAARGPLGRIANALWRRPGPEPFELDPYVARRAVMAQLAAAPGPGPGAAAP
jgi:hypothetical protein